MQNNCLQNGSPNGMPAFGMKAFGLSKSYKGIFDGNAEWLNNLNDVQRRLQDRLKTIGALGVNLHNIPSYSSFVGLQKELPKIDWLKLAGDNLSSTSAPSLSSDYRTVARSKIDVIKNTPSDNINAMSVAIKDLANTLRSEYESQITRLITEWQSYTLQITGQMGVVVQKLGENADTSKAYLEVAKEQQLSDKQKVVNASKEARRSFWIAILSLAIALLSAVGSLLLGWRYGRQAHVDSLETTSALTNALQSINDDLRKYAPPPGPLSPATPPSSSKR